MKEGEGGRNTITYKWGRRNGGSERTLTLGGGGGGSEVRDSDTPGRRWIDQQEGVGVRSN